MGFKIFLIDPITHVIFQFSFCIIKPDLILNDDSNRVGAQDTRCPAMRVQRSLGIRRGARSSQMSSGFIKQNIIFEEP
jgi:hypothetical protein